jgi:hypothetical protein
MGDPVYKPYERFRKAVASWLNFRHSISPASPAYEAQIAERWYALQVSELFRKLESVVTQRD